LAAHCTSNSWNHLGLEVLAHTPCNPDLARDNHRFWPTNKMLGVGQKFAAGQVVKEKLLGKTLL